MNNELPTQAPLDERIEKLEKQVKDLQEFTEKLDRFNKQLLQVVDIKQFLKLYNF